MILLITLNSQFIHSNLALRYLAAAAAHAGFSCRMMEFTINEEIEGIVRRIYQGCPDLAAFSCYIWNIEATLRVIQALKKLLPHLVIVVGGPEVSYDASAVLRDNPEIDVVIRGEGESTFTEFLQTWRDKSGWNSVRGITWRQDDEIRENPDRPVLQNLDLLPRPYDDSFVPDNRILYYETSRGCPFACSYCLSSVNPGVRYFSRERVKADLLLLAHKGVKQVKLVDRSFNCSPGRALELMEFMASLPGFIQFHLEIVPDLLDDNMLRFLSGLSAGKFQFEMGIQSANINTLQMINRRQDLDRAAHNIKRLVESGKIHIHLDLIAGLPGEDYQSLARSFNWIYQLQPDYLQVGFLKLLKGTRMREQAPAGGYIYLDYPPYEVLANRWIDFGEMSRIKVIESLVQKYYNSRAFTHVLSRIISEMYDSDAFRFYESFARYWEETDLAGRPVARPRLYDILGDFLNNQGPDNIEQYLELLRFDFIWHNPNQQVSALTLEMAGDRLRKRIKNYIKARHRQPGVQASDRIRVELFRHDILALAGITGACQEPREMYAVLFMWKEDKVSVEYVDLWSDDHEETPGNDNRS